MLYGTRNSGRLGEKALDEGIPAKQFEHEVNFSNLT